MIYYARKTEALRALSVQTIQRLLILDDDLAHLRDLKAQAEAAYDAMYDARSPSAAGVCYSDAKEFFYSAIGLARRLGLEAEVAQLEARLAHVRAVFRSQFT